MASMHASMMVTHGVQVVHEVQCVTAGFGSVIDLLFPARRRSGTVAPLDHVAAHIEASEGEVDQRGELVPALSHLSEELEVKDEDVWESPQAHLHHALLQLLTVRTLPCIVRGQLSKHRWKKKEFSASFLQSSVSLTCQTNESETNWKAIFSLNNNLHFGLFFTQSYLK